MLHYALSHHTPDFFVSLFFLPFACVPAFPLDRHLSDSLYFEAHLSASRHLFPPKISASASGRPCDFQSPVIPAWKKKKKKKKQTADDRKTDDLLLLCEGYVGFYLAKREGGCLLRPRYSLPRLEMASTTKVPLGQLMPPPPPPPEPGDTRPAGPEKPRLESAVGVSEDTLAARLPAPVPLAAEAFLAAEAVCAVIQDV